MNKNKSILIICRNREWNDIHYKEFLFEYDIKTNLLKLAKWHPRFNKRILTKEEIIIDTINYKCVTVDSKAFDMEEFSSYKIKNTQGIWLVPNDIVKKGENKFEKIEGKRCFFDVAIQEEDAQILEVFFDKQKISKDFPMVAYHGTDLIHAKSIEKEGLKESWGMLGKAVYVGTFWKACRFACFDKQYHAQPGQVFRLYAFAKTFQHFPFDPEKLWECPCSTECKKHCSDHLGIWQIMNDGAHVNIGNSKGNLKNEEWAFKERFVFLTSYAEIEPYTYNPFKRNIQIK